MNLIQRFTKKPVTIQGGATRAVGGLVLLSFLYLWIRMLIEAES